ncbi:hypothetical protein BRC97_04085 [Halobacteriales archaeon QS_6_71_20]|nr:MAG: hypothetical protein BRC97_04085 [Halobacteriales archaeon QS_6_71_20]
MTESPNRDGSEGTNRRTVLGGIGAAVGGGALVGGGAASAAGQEEATYVVEQGDRCVPLEPVSGSEPVEEFYGYEQNSNEVNSQQSNTGLESPSTSRLFLYEGPEALSLVLLQGGGVSEPGGAASMLISGLPRSGEWAVRDDGYQGATDEFLETDREAVIHWAWGTEGRVNRRNDGGAFRGLGDDFCVSLRAAFNEDAKFEPFNEGRVDGIEALSGGGDQPEPVSLDTEAPITVRTGSCDDDPERCTMATATAEEPFAATLTFTCTAVAVEAGEFDAVALEFDDDTTRRFEGPFEGFGAFIDDRGAERSESGSGTLRAVRVEAGDEQVEAENPIADRCRSIAAESGDDSDDGGGDGDDSGGGNGGDGSDGGGDGGGIGF